MINGLLRCSFVILSHQISFSNTLYISNETNFILVNYFIFLFIFIKFIGVTVSLANYLMCHFFKQFFISFKWESELEWFTQSSSILTKPDFRSVLSHPSIWRIAKLMAFALYSSYLAKCFHLQMHYLSFFWNKTINFPSSSSTSSSKKK